MSIRNQARSIIRADRKIYAKVESIALGKATVRLGETGSGARMTNVPYTGDITPGDVVILDNTPDPIVYPTTIKREEETLLELSPSGSVGPTLLPTLPTAKLTASKTQTEPYTYYNGTVIRSFHEYYSDPLLFDTGILFDTVVWDPSELAKRVTYYAYSGYDGGMNGVEVSRAGMYHLSAGVKVKTDSGNLSRGLYMGFYRGHYNSSTHVYNINSWIGNKRVRWNASPSQETVLHINTICRLKENDFIGVTFQHRYNAYYANGSGLMTSIKDTSYPYLTITLIADQETEVAEAQRDWFLYLPTSWEPNDPNTY